MIDRLAVYLARKVRKDGTVTRRHAEQLLSRANLTPDRMTEVLDYAVAEGWLIVSPDQIRAGEHYPEWTLERDTVAGRLYSHSGTMGHELHSSREG
jgi:hypothetical protein